MTAEQIHELGLSEVKRLRGELEKVQAQIGFEGDLQAFFKHMQDDPARLFPNTDAGRQRSEEHTSELQSLMRISYAVFCLKKKKQNQHQDHQLNRNIQYNTKQQQRSTKQSQKLRNKNHDLS